MLNTLYKYIIVITLLIQRKYYAMNNIIDKLNVYKN